MPKNRLFGPKRWYFRWKDPFSAEKLAFHAKKSACRAEKVTFQMKRYLFGWKVGFSCQKIGLSGRKGDFSDEKVPFRLKSWLFMPKNRFFGSKRWLFKLKGTFSVYTQCLRIPVLGEGVCWGGGKGSPECRKSTYPQQRRQACDFDFGNLSKRSTFCHIFEHLTLLYFRLLYLLVYSWAILPSLVTTAPAPSRRNDKFARNFKSMWGPRQSRRKYYLINWNFLVDHCRNYLFRGMKEISFVRKCLLLTSVGEMTLHYGICNAFLLRSQRIFAFW